MDEFVGLLIMLAIVLFAAGPVAVIMAMVLFNKLSAVERRLNRLEFEGYESPIKPQQIPYAPPTAKPVEESGPQAQAQTESVAQIPLVFTEPVDTSVSQSAETDVNSFDIPKQPVAPVVAEMPEFTAASRSVPKADLELKIGTTVASVVGVITLILGVGFFLKYVYENMTFPPLGRVCMVAGGGLVALIVGEVTRHRGYGIVAKGLASLGFALFYAAVFSAARVYALIDLPVALIIALGITIAAMMYAVCLNERLIAFLSLLGGYLSPLIIMFHQDMPIPVFGYVLALSIGAMACAMIRRWRAVNWMALVGTYLLYTVWFEQFYAPGRMAEPLTWLGIFGAMYLLQPIVYGLVRKVRCYDEDVALVIVNSIAVFYYLCRILSSNYQDELSLAIAVFGVLHLVLMGAVMIRCREDDKLAATLGVLGTAFVTTAIGLYFSELRPMLISWSIEAVTLTFIGLRYKSLWPKAMAMLVASVASVGLIYHLPMHDGAAFKLIFNAPFATWLFVCAAILVCHVLWRLMGDTEDVESRLASQAFYIWGILLLAAGCALEWFAWCDWTMISNNQQQSFVLMGFMVIASVLPVAFWARPLCPKGEVLRVCGMITAVIGAVYTAVAMTEVYYDTFLVFANLPFILAALYVLVVLLSARLARRPRTDKNLGVTPSAFLVLLAIILLWVLLSEQIYQYWYCRNQYAVPIANWRFAAQMVMSLSWAIYAAVLLLIGFYRRAAGVRYLSLAIFAVLLAKINWDIQELPTEYRIATFVTTGLILVGVSFLYQFLKKKGFFETVESGNQNEKIEKISC